MEQLARTRRDGLELSHESLNAGTQLYSMLLQFWMLKALLLTHIQTKEPFQEFEVGDAPICHVGMHLSEVTCRLIFRD